jgi:hypothetical protein
MLVRLAAAWPYPTPPVGTWDFMPLVWGALILVAVRAAGVRLRWWGIVAAVAGGLPCEALASRFGTWAAFAVAAMAFSVGLPIARLRRSA